MNNINPTTVYTMNTDHIDKFINLVPDNELEAKLLPELRKVIRRAILKLKKDYDVNIFDDEDGVTKGVLSDYTNEFIADKQLINMSKKEIIKFKQAIEYLHIFYGAKYNIRKLTYKDAADFRRFLLQVPKNWKGQAELRDKNLKVMIEKKAKILDKYDKQQISTVLEVMKRVKNMFRSFEKNIYIYKNHFHGLDLIKAKDSTKREFEPRELKAIFNYCETEYKQEEYNFIKLLLYTGLRRGEALSITREDIYIDNYMIDIDGTKTENAKRIAIIHKDLVEVVKEQFLGKVVDEYLFFDDEIKLLTKNPRHKDKTKKEIFELNAEKIGTRINKIIKDVLGDEHKKDLDIHSIRKNFSQEIFMVKEIKDLEMKTLIGHSTKSDTTDKHYLRGKRDHKGLKVKVDKADFSSYF